MQIVWANSLVMFGVKVFCKVVCKIFLSWLPCDIEVVSGYLVGDPEEVLFHSSRLLFFDSVIGYGGGSAVVAMHWCGRLFVPQLFECKTKDGCVLAVVEKCTEFCFGCRCDNEFAYVGGGVDGAVQLYWLMWYRILP